MNRSYVWDIWTRLFHWSLVVLISISLYTGFVGGFEEMDWHMYSGYAILGLLLFRLGWGVLGPRNARFATFVRGPGAVLDYLRRVRSSGPGVGHSPLAALSVIALLAAVLVQATTGLFATDDIFIEGPLVGFVSDETSGQMTGIHDTNRWIIIGLVVLHLLAIAGYELLKKERLVLPMITGYKKGVDAPPEQNRLLVGLVLLAVTAGAVYYIVEIL